MDTITKLIFTIIIITITTAIALALMGNLVLAIVTTIIVEGVPIAVLWSEA